MTRPLTAADVLSDAIGMVDDPAALTEYFIAIGDDVYRREDCTACCWCGGVEPIDWQTPVEEGHVCTDCEAEREYETAGRYYSLPVTL